jgi:predicted DNA-binding protein with PD1-like motif
MKHKLLNAAAGARSFALVFDTGDEVLAGLREFADSRNLAAAHFSAIGAFQDVILGWFDWDRRDYQRIPLREQVEVLSLLGDVTLNDNKRTVHAHVVVGTSSAQARGGHLLEAHVRPTLELFLQEDPSHLRRTFDPQAQIPLISLQ